MNFFSYMLAILLGRGAYRGRKKHGSGFLGEIIPSSYCDEYGLWI